MKNVLSSQQLPENASMETIGRAYHAMETIVQVLPLPDPWSPCNVKQWFSTIFVYQMLVIKIQGQNRQWHALLLSLHTDECEIIIRFPLHVV